MTSDTLGRVRGLQPGMQQLGVITLEHLVAAVERRYARVAITFASREVSLSFDNVHTEFYTNRRTGDPSPSTFVGTWNSLQFSADPTPFFGHVVLLDTPASFHSGLKLFQPV